MAQSDPIRLPASSQAMGATVPPPKQVLLATNPCTPSRKGPVLGGDPDAFRAWRPPPLAPPPLPATLPVPCGPSPCPIRALALPCLLSLTSMKRERETME